MGLAGGDVLPVEVTVEIDRGVDLGHDGIGLRLKAPAPHFVTAHDASAEDLPPMTELPAEPHYKVRRRRVVSVAALCGTLAVLAGVYGIVHLRRNPADQACQAAVNNGAKIAPLVHGEVAAFSLAQAPFRVPDL